MGEKKGSRRSVRRWFKSTSNRTFIVYPLALLAIEYLLQRGFPRLDWWGVPLLLWGYLQYWIVGGYRLNFGGGGPGLSNPPERLVTTGIYRYTRNPMYLGHLIFMTGLAWALRSWAGLGLLAFHVVWFNRRACEDEAQLVELFGEPYLAYQKSVKRWVPWLI